MARAMQLATELAEGPQVAMRLLKRATYNAAALCLRPGRRRHRVQDGTLATSISTPATAPRLFRAAAGRVQQVAGRWRGDRDGDYATSTVSSGMTSLGVAVAR